MRHGQPRQLNSQCSLGAQKGCSTPQKRAHAHVVHVGARGVQRSTHVSPCTRAHKRCFISSPLSSNRRPVAPRHCTSGRWGAADVASLTVSCPQCVKKRRSAPRTRPDRRKHTQCTLQKHCVTGLFSFLLVHLWSLRRVCHVWATGGCFHRLRVPVAVSGDASPLDSVLRVQFRVSHEADRKFESNSQTIQA